MRSSVLMLLLTTSFLLSAKIINVNVLTLSNIPLSVNAVSQAVGNNTKLSVSVSDLDDITNVMQQLNEISKTQHGLLDPDSLKNAMYALLTKNKERIQQAGRGIGLATSLGLQQVPAVIFNKRYIVLGTTDVLAAYEYYRAWKNNQGDKS